MFTNARNFLVLIVLEKHEFYVKKSLKTHLSAVAHVINHDAKSVDSNLNDFAG